MGASVSCILNRKYQILLPNPCMQLLLKSLEGSYLDVTESRISVKVF